MQGVSGASACALGFAMGSREEGVRAWNTLCKGRKKVDVDIVRILVLKIDGFRHHLQAYKRTSTPSRWK